ESPYNLIHVRNMAAVMDAGAVVLPASPAFWHRPETIEDLVDSVVERILVHAGVEPPDRTVWEGLNV
ncbi:MAG: flavoprotein, partial [Candidatus Thorarchaeota archaeon]